MSPDGVRTRADRADADRADAFAERRYPKELGEARAYVRGTPGGARTGATRQIVAYAQNA